MIKYALIDLDDTILDFTRGEIEAVRDLLEQFHLPNVEAGIQTYLKINQETWHAIERGGDRTTLLNQRFAKTFQQFDIQADGTKLNHEYLAMISNNFYLVPGARELLKQLQQMGINIIAATNGVARNQIKRLKGAGIYDYFQTVWISETAGVAKPDPQFFTRLFQTDSAMNTENTVMIGDGIYSDMLGANRAGIRNIWFNMGGHKTLPEGITATATVTNLDQVADAVKQLDK